MENLKIIKCNNDKPFPINEYGPPLTEGNEYSLIEIFTCGCGEQHYNVGLELHLNYVQCYKCREDLPKTNHWCHSSRFSYS